MKQRRENKNYCLFFSLVITFVFLLIHAHHDCDGDDCIICFLSLFILFISNAALLIKFIPVIAEKIIIYINAIYSKYSHHNVDKEKEFINYNPININNYELTDLITFGVKIQ